MDYAYKNWRCIRRDGRQCRFVGVPHLTTGSNGELYEVWRRQNPQTGPHEEGCHFVGKNEQFKDEVYANRPFPAYCVACGGDPFCVCPEESSA
jgi:hypothetical protein